MKSNLLLIAICVLLCFSFTFVTFKVILFKPEIPKTWDFDSLQHFQLPLADSSVKVIFPPEGFYYGASEMKIYKTYPFYVKSSEPANYIEELLEKEPEIAFSTASLQTEQDWIKAGEIAYEAPTAISAIPPNFAEVVEQSLETIGVPVAKDGEVPYISYVIREKGKIELGAFSCSMCHNRVMPDGVVIKGGQGSFNQDRVDGLRGFESVESFMNFRKGLYDAPWVDSAHNSFRQMTAEEILEEMQNMPNGVLMRHGSAPYYPTAIPSLIGIKDIKYLDHTGLMQHRSPGDLMRYSAFNMGMDRYVDFGGYIPDGINNYTELPQLPTNNNGGAATRYSEAQLFAITQYLYSLEQPKNPHQYEPELLARGEKVFIEEGCVTCHTPPLYTNNMLTPVDGFEPPADHFEKYDIFNVSVETDPGLALYTRRGTGYYKIPSLLGLWHRSPLGHSGEVATLEDWFDPARLEDDYIPTGYKPVHVTHKAVPGHDFGMFLDPNDKSSLIAFLRSL